MRDRAGLFWSFFFPLFFIVIFGSVLGKSGDREGVRFPVALVLEDSSPEVAWLPEAFSHPPLDTRLLPRGEAIRQLRAGDLRAAVIFPADTARTLAGGAPTDVRILTDPGQPQMSMVAAGLIQQRLSDIEARSFARMAGRDPDKGRLFRARMEAVGNGGKPAAPAGISFLLPGILTMTIMQLGLFTAIPLINMREKGILKRYQATPLPCGAIVAAQVTNRLVIALIQTLVIIGVGVALFQFRLSGSWVLLIPLIVFGVLTFISIGAVLSAVAKTQESGVSLVQLVNFPMMFLSGLFFPIDALPKLFAPIVRAIPATYLADLLRHVMVGAPLARPAVVDVAVLGAWLVGALFIASRTFRWE
jgi:ABC-2 type transport system permease protein